MTPLESATAALQQEDGPRCGRTFAAIEWDEGSVIHVEGECTLPVGHADRCLEIHDSPTWAHLRAAFAECDRLAAENADIRAQAGGMDMDITELRVQLHGFRLTLDNERGRGAPPSARWYAVAGGGWAAATGHVAHCAPGEWHWRDSGAGGISPTARDAMKAADKVAK